MATHTERYPPIIFEFQRFFLCWHANVDRKIDICNALEKSYNFSTSHKANKRVKWTTAEKMSISRRYCEKWKIFVSVKSLISSLNGKATAATKKHSILRTARTLFSAAMALLSSPRAPNVHIFHFHFSYFGLCSTCNNGSWGLIKSYDKIQARWVGRTKWQMAYAPATALIPFH